MQQQVTNTPPPKLAAWNFPGKRVNLSFSLFEKSPLVRSKNNKKLGK
jgi:hypothetical protein